MASAIGVVGLAEELGVGPCLVVLGESLTRVDLRWLPNGAVLAENLPGEELDFEGYEQLVVIDAPASRVAALVEQWQSYTAAPLWLLYSSAGCEWLAEIARTLPIRRSYSVGGSPGSLVALMIEKDGVAGAPEELSVMPPKHDPTAGFIIPSETPIHRERGVASASSTGWRQRINRMMVDPPAPLRAVALKLPKPVLRVTYRILRGLVR